MSNSFSNSFYDSFIDSEEDDDFGSQDESEVQSEAQTEPEPEPEPEPPFRHVLTKMFKKNYENKPIVMKMQDNCILTYAKYNKAPKSTRVTETFGLVVPPLKICKLHEIKIQVKNTENGETQDIALVKRDALLNRKSIPMYKGTMCNEDDTTVMRIFFDTSCGVSRSVLHLLTLTIPPSPHIHSLIHSLHTHMFTHTLF